MHLMDELVLNGAMIQSADFFYNFQPQANAVGVRAFLLKTLKQFFRIQ